MSVIIEQKEIIKTFTITSFKIVVVNIVLNEKCDIIVSLFDSDQILQRQEILVLQGDDYINWGSDDEYLYDYVASHYGFTIIHSESKEQTSEPINITE